MPAINLVISGLVQGVGFRDWTRRVARRLEVMGEVWNRTDGAVEVIAIHQDLAVLDDFAAQMPKGPGRVDNVTRSSAPDSLSADEFRVGPTR